MSIATEASAAPVRPIPIVLTMTFDKDLYEGQGGFYVKFHSTPCMGISLTARSYYTKNEHGDFLDIEYDIQKKPKDLPPGYEPVLEYYLNYYFAMGRRSR